MSRKKSRQQTKPELVREGSRPALPAEAQATVHRLTGKLRDTLEAIISGCALSAQSTELLDAANEILPAFDGELVDREDDESAELDDDAFGVNEELAVTSIEITRRILARALLARTLDRPLTQIGRPLISSEPGAEANIEDKAIDELVRPLLPSNLPPDLQLSRAEHREAFAEAEFLIREVGLEEFDVSCDLETAGDGTPELLIYPLSPESAHVALLQYLFKRAESVAINLDPLLDVERQASGWEFWRWSVSPPPGDESPEVAEFARGVREQEYSLADRRTITLGTSVMGELATDDGFAEIFPRQHRMAAALAASFVDVFECVAVEGTRVTLRSMRDGRTYSVHEHTGPIDYALGWVAAGRLLPFDGEVHLRSPGMIFFQPEDSAFVTAAAQALGDPDGTLPPALELEAFISSAVFDVRVPRTEKPARSKAAAREMLAALTSVLADAVMDRDPTLEAFMMALAEQATAGKPQDTARRAHKKKKKTKRRR